MDKPQIQFNDGEAYERMMGTWSRIAGEVFLDWIGPKRGLTWADIGCGNGAFTQLIVDRCAPALVKGIDPSAGQIEYAKTRLASAPIELTTGDATALLYADNSVDVAVMALVLFFVPDAAKGFAEMVRVTKPGGIVASYTWDIPGGGFPADAIWAEAAAAGHPMPKPPSAAISKMDALKALWESALDDVETKVIEVERRFDGFEDYWDSCIHSSIGVALKKLPSEQVALIKERVSARLAGGRFTARATAAKGRVRS